MGFFCIILLGVTYQIRYKNPSPFKQWLRQHGITQQSVADVLGISRSSMSQKLNGGIAWSEADLRHINSTYGLSADFILGFKKARREVVTRAAGPDPSSEIQGQLITLVSLERRRV